MAIRGPRRLSNAPIVGLIASRNATPALEKTVASLLNAGADKVIVVDDGSDTTLAREVFDRIEATHGSRVRVIHLLVNGGKAAALRVGFAEISPNSIIMQTDDDTLAGIDLRAPARWIIEGRADIIDVRVEVIPTGSLIGWAQELDYWAINTIVKRLQNWIRARTWMSGASVMYSYAAGKELILPQAHSMTEDTEGLFRAHGKGFRVRFYASKATQFYTMVPETLPDIRKQWKRWATGNAQVLARHGLGSKRPHVVFSNVMSWLQTLMFTPIITAVLSGVLPTLEWMFASGVIIGIIGAIARRRWPLALMGWTLPIATTIWAYHAVEGIFLAWQRSRSGETSLTWTPPERTSIAA